VSCPAVLPFGRPYPFEPPETFEPFFYHSFYDPEMDNSSLFPVFPHHSFCHVLAGGEPCPPALFLLGYRQRHFRCFLCTPPLSLFCVQLVLDHFLPPIRFWRPISLSLYRRFGIFLRPTPVATQALSPLRPPLHTFLIVFFLPPMSD